MQPLQDSTEILFEKEREHLPGRTCLFRVKEPKEVQHLLSLLRLEPWGNGVPGCHHTLWAVFKSPSGVTSVDFCRVCFGDYQMPKRFFAVFERLARKHRARQVAVRYVAVSVLGGFVLGALVGQLAAVTIVLAFLLVAAAAALWRVSACREPRRHEIVVQFLGYSESLGVRRARFGVCNESPFPVLRLPTVWIELKSGASSTPSCVYPTVFPWLECGSSECVEVECPTAAGLWRLAVLCRRTNMQHDLLDAVTTFLYLGVPDKLEPEGGSAPFYSEWQDA